jgi:enamine deaminase RidA (YjgF/YER057c/UK114 family)
MNYRVEERAGRRFVSTDSKWEPIVGYSRAVRVGATIAVTGSLGTREDGNVAEGIAAQTEQSLRNIFGAIEALGGRREDIIRTRLFVTDIGQWEAVGRVHGELLGDVMPATTMIEISRLIVPEAMIEIEADAVVVEQEG